MNVSRRAFLRTSLRAAVLPLTGCSLRSDANVRWPYPVYDLKRVEEFKQTVFRIKRVNGPAVILLHELPGLSPDNIWLARLIANSGFTVYLPLLFGQVGQDNFISGYFQSCVFGEFECSKLSTSSPALSWLRTVCDQVIKTSGSQIGVIGMCLTGALPLALLREGVAAAVMCQPTVPFNLFAGRPVGEQKSDIGLDPQDINVGVESNVPLLAMRYGCDDKCPKERINKLRSLFHHRLADIELNGDGHSTLAGNFDYDAFTDTIKYLKVRLGVEQGPKQMKLAKLDGRQCEITADGNWHHR